MDVLEQEDFFLLSSISIKELEEIKSSGKKSDEVKYAARTAVRYLNENRNKYQIIIYNDHSLTELYKMGLPDNNDNKIMQSARHAIDALGYDNLVFVTDDLVARLIARSMFGLDVYVPESEHDEDYKGYSEFCLSDDEIAYFYSHMDINQFDLLTNQYLILKNIDGVVLDTYKWNGNTHEIVKQKQFKSNIFGIIKPLDEIQKCAFDSLVNNEITVLFGRASSGKTTLPLNYIMQGLEKGTFKKCYIIYSYEPLKGAKTLGYEKGDHTTKLLYSASIGNILSSKFGDIQMVERLIDIGQIDIIPTANIRGVEFESDSVVLVTEAQNLDTYTLKTIIQRCKEGCKQIYEGDIIEQRDTNISNPGISKLIEIFKNDPSFGCIKLKKSYRGRLTELADKM